SRLAVVPGVGYPNPNRSHFESMAVWHTARLAAAERHGLGWLGRALDGAGALPTGTPAAVYVGAGLLPEALPGRPAVAVSPTKPDDFALPPGTPLRHAASVPTPDQDLAAFVQRSALDGYATADRMAEAARVQDGDARYPATELAGQLRLMARLIKAGFGARVYYAKQAGYDTHSGRFAAHAALLGERAAALRAFPHGRPGRGRGRAQLQRVRPHGEGERLRGYRPRHGRPRVPGGAAREAGPARRPAEPAGPRPGPRRLEGGSGLPARVCDGPGGLVGVGGAGAAAGRVRAAA